MKRLTPGALAASMIMLASLWPSVAEAQDLGQIVAQARRDGLPASALDNKIKEGRAKGVPTARIAQVVNRLAGHMRSAKVWLSKPATPKSKPRKVSGRLIVSVAEARLAGVDKRSVQTLLAGKRFPSAASQRVDGLADLKLRGYSPQRSVELLRRARVMDLAGVGRSADRLRRSTGLSHNKVLSRMTLQLRRSGRLNGVRQRPGSRGPGAGLPGARGLGPGARPSAPPPPSRFR